jgi:regulator of RNase E activity RraA
LSVADAQANNETSILLNTPSNLDDDVFSRWRNIPTSIIADAANGTAHLPPAIRPLRPAGQQPYLFGRAVTVQCEPPGLSAIIQGIFKLGPGDVLVLAAGGNDSVAMCGDIFAGTARRAGCVGIVCDGALRDVRGLAQWDDFSVFTRAITPRAGVLQGGGAVNIPVCIGDKTIAPGDLVIGDDDGVAVLSRLDAERLLPWALNKIQREKDWVKALEKGASILDVFDVATG